MSFTNEKDSVKSSGSDNAKLQDDHKHFPSVAVDEPVLIAGTVTSRPFDSDSLDSFRRPIDSYEGIHRYDPEFEWTAAEEKRVVRKVRRDLLHPDDR